MKGIGIMFRQGSPRDRLLLKVKCKDMQFLFEAVSSEERDTIILTLRRRLADAKLKK